MTICGILEYYLVFYLSTLLCLYSHHHVLSSLEQNKCKGTEFVRPFTPGLKVFLP